MISDIKCCLLVVTLVVGGGAERWQWPAESVRVDSKVQFTDHGADSGRTRFHLEQLQDEEAPFEPPSDTGGFYNRPPGDGRYPVRVRDRSPLGHDWRNGGQLPSDGTLDSLQFCKCVSSPCDHPVDSSACGPSQHMCCYSGRPRAPVSEYFNEINDGRPMTYPAQSSHFGPFQPPGPPHGAFQPSPHHGNPPKEHMPQVLVGPGGPTGIIGPNKPVYGHKGPTGPNDPHKPVLVGPGGPTGIIGPTNDNNRNSLFAEDLGSNESAQRGVLVGPGGPTGMIGPAYNNRPILVGPGGPTGIIGPRRQYPTYRGGVLVGPGGPTGTIGPNRGVLVGPGGPTGRIGPWGYGK